MKNYSYPNAGGELSLKGKAFGLEKDSKGQLQHSFTLGVP